MKWTVSDFMTFFVTFNNFWRFQILLNACDNKFRDPSMSEIFVEIISGEVNLIQVIWWFIKFTKFKMILLEKVWNSEQS